MFQMSAIQLSASIGKSAGPSGVGPWAHERLILGGARAGLAPLRPKYPGALFCGALFCSAAGAKRTEDPMYLTAIYWSCHAPSNFGLP